MASRLLTRLDAAIAAASTLTKADCLRAERAALLARLGRVGDARTVLSSLQMQYSTSPHPMVNAWLCLADGLLCYFTDLSHSARDRVHRAYALSGATRDNRLRALSAAWLGFMDYTRGDFKGMPGYAAQALELAEPDHHAAQSRASMVVAMVYHLCDRYDLAQPWYAKARGHAQAEGDEATLSALGHNYALMIVNLAREHQLSDPTQERLIRQALLANDSTHNLDKMMGSSALAGSALHQRAEIYCLQARWGEALDLYDKHLAEWLQEGFSSMECSMRADKAWAHLQLGQLDLARQEARLAAQATGHKDCPLSDRMATHGRLAQVYGQLSESEAEAKYLALVDADREATQRIRTEVLALCEQELDKIQNKPDAAKPGNGA